MVSKFSWKQELSFWRKRRIWRKLHDYAENWLWWYCCCWSMLFFPEKVLGDRVADVMVAVPQVFDLYQLLFWGFIRFFFFFSFPFFFLNIWKKLSQYNSWFKYGEFQFPQYCPFLLKPYVCFPEKVKTLLLSSSIHRQQCLWKESWLMRTVMWKCSLECSVKSYVSALRQRKNRKEKKKTHYSKEDKY